MPDDDQMMLDWSRYDRAQFGAVLPDDPETKDRAENVRTRLQAMMATDPGWWEINDLAEKLGQPPQSISARLRDLRKPQYGGHRVHRRLVRKGLWEYRLEVAEGSSAG